MFAALLFPQKRETTGALTLRKMRGNICTGPCCGVLLHGAGECNGEFHMALLQGVFLLGCCRTVCDDVQTRFWRVSESCWYDPILFSMVQVKEQCHSSITSWLPGVVAPWHIWGMLNSVTGTSHCLFAPTAPFYAILCMFSVFVLVALRQATHRSEGLMRRRAFVSGEDHRLP